MDKEYSRNIILVDVSSFMFLEATGDSELDSNGYSTGPVDSHHRICLADDDAQSCKSSSDHSVRASDDDKMDFHADDDDATSVSCCLQVDSKDTSVYNSEKDDEDVVEQRWNNTGYGGGRCKKFKASDSGDLVMEKLKNQKEDDRLFWESCLAS